MSSEATARKPLPGSISVEPAAGRSGAAAADLPNGAVLSSLVSLPLEDGVVVVGPGGAVYALDAAGYRLWGALQAGWGPDDLVGACVREGGLPADQARASILSTLESWRQLGLIDAPRTGPSLVDVGFARQPGREPALDAVYVVGERPVRLRCDDAALGALIDAACASARGNGSLSATACVDLIEQGGRFAVRADDVTLARAPAPTATPASARHRCLTALLESARHQRRWLGFLHAAAVAEGGHCILLSGEAGSGKSTLAAALVATGASFVTDDYVPLERGSWLVWPVPYAPSIKRGSWRALSRHYPALRTAPVHRHRSLELRYLQLDEVRRVPLNRGVPVRALVFPRYEKGAAGELRQITVAEALTRLCHAASILDRRPEVLAETLRWVGAVPRYELVHGDLETAVGQVRSLLR